VKEKNGPNFPDFKNFYTFGGWGIARFLHQFPVSSQNIRGFLKIFYFHVGYIAKFG
jgi:hypothetical protein